MSRAYRIGTFSVPDNAGMYQNTKSVIYGVDQYKSILFLGAPI